MSNEPTTPTAEETVCKKGMHYDEETACPTCEDMETSSCPFELANAFPKKITHINDVIDLAGLPSEKRGSDYIALMNTRFMQELEGISEVNLDEGVTPVNRHEEIKSLVDTITDEMSSATDEEIALLAYLHSEGETDLWFDGLNDTGREFWEAGTVIEEGNAEYAVVPTKSLDRCFENYMDNYIDEVVMPEIPKAYQFYFDNAKFANDCRISDGYGTMASYDGNENEIHVGDQMYHIFRLN